MEGALEEVVCERVAECQDKLRIITADYKGFSAPMSGIQRQAQRNKAQTCNCTPLPNNSELLRLRSRTSKRGQYSKAAEC
jgi:hypothetical protein